MHTLSDRMEMIRAANSDPRLTSGQRALLVNLLTRMPFEVEQGWYIYPEMLAYDLFRADTPGHRRVNRRNMKALEEAGLIARVWAGSRRDHTDVATIYVNYKALRSWTCQVRDHGPVRSGDSLLSTHKVPTAASDEDANGQPVG